MSRFILFLLIMSLSAGKTTIAQEQTTNPGPATIVIKKCSDFQITGNGSSEAWKMTEWVNLIPRNPEDIDYETKVKVLYSEKGIYFLFDCKDKKLTSTFKADNLDLWKEDVVEVFFWTDETFPVYFEYEISPMNYELPIIVPNYKGSFLGWLPWHYEGDKRTQHMTSVTGGKKKSGSTITTWMAEFYIPFKLLAPLNNVPPVSGTKWRANMYRIDHDSGSKSFYWQKTNTNFHEYNSFGTFIFE